MAHFRMRPTEDLVRIASAGGGFELSARMRPTPDLVRIATAARSGGAHVIMSHLNMRPTEDLVQIATAGRGHVSFRGDAEAIPVEK